MRNNYLPNTLRQELYGLLGTSRLLCCDGFLQHGDTTVLLHCMAVAYFSLKLIRQLGLQCDERSLVRGALLHDYYLYDWHQSDKSHRRHGFHHAAKALQNARADVALNRREEDIILHHMFPLTPQPPRCREAAVVCLVDKVCGIYETLGRNTYPRLRQFRSEWISESGK